MRFSYLFGLLIFTLLLSNTAKTQEQIGLRLENYSGISAVMLNPSWQSTNPLSWDLNILEMSQFADNNYLFVENTSLFGIINANDILTPENEVRPLADDELYLDFYETNRKKYLSIFTELMGPSLAIRLKNNAYFGFFAKVRGGLSVQDIPPSLGYYRLMGRQGNEAFRVAKFQVAAMTWSELGLNYAHKIDTYSGHISVGASVKFLTGYEALYAKNNTAFDAVQASGDTVFIQSPDFSFGYTNTNTGIIDGERFEESRNGNGFGMDIGATYVYEGNEENYKFKIGAALLDIGGINFRRNTDDYLIRFDSIQAFAGNDYMDFMGLDSFITQAGMNIYDNPDDLRVGNSFKIGLPTALSIQGDYMVLPQFYVSGLFIQRLKTSKLQVSRGNLVAVTPRFEHRWIAASLPFVLYNYQHFDVGLSIRLAFLTLGTDNLGSLIRKNRRFSGTDFYFGLKINPFNLGWNIGGGGGNTKGPKCYSF